MKVVIIEDEKPAADRLQTLLLQYDAGIQIETCLESIEESINYFNTHAHPDLVFADVHLSDGHSFEIFKNIDYNNPIIFTTAYDTYAVDAFKLVSIDYILKPVTQKALALAINKFKSIVNRYTLRDLMRVPSTLKSSHFKERFVGKVGSKLYFIEAENIAYFQADNKIVYLVDRSGNRYVVEYTLEKLELMLDPKKFFRLNRTFIIHNRTIIMAKRMHGNRLKIHTEVMSQNDELILSREKIHDFRVWAEQ